VKSSSRIASLVGVLGLIVIGLPVVGQATAEITIVDQRSADSLKSRRSSVFSAIAFLPEKAVTPPPLEQLRNALTTRATQPLSLVVSEMRVIDFFPARLNAGMPGGAIGSAISEQLVDSKTDWSLIDALGLSAEEDSVICVLAVTVDDKQVSFAAHASYDLGRGAMVRSNANFKAAVTSSIDQVAQKLIDFVAPAQATE
jgi:hypothetical protein